MAAVKKPVPKHPPVKQKKIKTQTAEQKNTKAATKQQNAQRLKAAREEAKRQKAKLKADRDKAKQKAREEKAKQKLEKAEERKAKQDAAKQKKAAELKARQKVKELRQAAQLKVKQAKQRKASLRKAKLTRDKLLLKAAQLKSKREKVKMTKVKPTKVATPTSGVSSAAPQITLPPTGVQQANKQRPTVAPPAIPGVRPPQKPQVTQPSSVQQSVAAPHQHRQSAAPQPVYRPPPVAMQPTYRPPPVTAQPAYRPPPVTAQQSPYPHAVAPSISHQQQAARTAVMNMRSHQGAAVRSFVAQQLQRQAVTQPPPQQQSVVHSPIMLVAATAYPQYTPPSVTTQQVYTPVSAHQVYRQPPAVTAYLAHTPPVGTAHRVYGPPPPLAAQPTYPPHPAVAQPSYFQQPHTQEPGVTPSRNSLTHPAMSPTELEQEKARNRMGCALTPSLRVMGAVTGLNIPSVGMRNLKYDKGFCSEKCPHGSLHNTLHTHWKGPLNHRAYYCPWGWYRFSLNVEDIVRLYPSCWNWESWETMYHGTTPAAINSILNPSDPGKFKKNAGYLGVAAYFSPSIRYVAFPAYSYVTTANENGATVHYQLALEVRGDRSRHHVKSSTQTVKQTGFPIDVNHDDATFKYIVALFGSDPYVDYVNANDGVIVTGLMVRKLRIHPKDLDECRWISQVTWFNHLTPKPIHVPQQQQRQTYKRPRSPTPLRWSDSDSDSDW